LLYLVHHGDAVGPDIDAMRPLSDRGRLEVEKLARQAAARGTRPAVIWHSGKLRARQTAELFWRHCNPFASIAAMHGLQPADPVGRIVDAIRGEHCDRSHIDEGGRDAMIVGHFPHLPRLLGALLTGNPEAAPADSPLHGIVAVAGDTGGRWREEWRLVCPA
jgi:phosphohistidine phosphatase